MNFLHVPFASFKSSYCNEHVEVLPEYSVYKLYNTLT